MSSKRPASSSAAQPHSKQPLAVVWAELQLNMHQLQLPKHRQYLQKLLSNCVDANIQIIGLTDFAGSKNPWRKEEQPADRERRGSTAVKNAFHQICGDILGKASYSVYTAKACAVLLSAAQKMEKQLVFV